MSTLEGHTNFVYCIQWNKQVIISGSEDCSIKVWSFTPQTSPFLKTTLTGHSRGVVTVKFIDQCIICSGSSDCTIKVWDLSSGANLYTLKQHEAGVWNIAVTPRLLISSGLDKALYVWDFTAKEEEQDDLD